MVVLFSVILLFKPTFTTGKAVSPISVPSLRLATVEVSKKVFTGLSAQIRKELRSMEKAVA